MLSTQTQRILRQHLRTDALLGIKAVPLGNARPGAVASEASATGETPRPKETSAPSQNAALSSPSPSPAPASAPAPAPMERSAKIASLERVDAKEVRGCTKCGLCDSRTQTVFGEGDPDAAIMFIGEGPGHNEDEQGRPFVGRAGTLLNKMLAAMTLQREDVYITNVVKCRPPNNRTPKPAEAEACWDYLRRQIETIQPQVIVTLGSPATQRLLDTTTGITKLRGTWQQFPGFQPPIPVMPTFHPSYLLYAYSRENRALVWSDLQAVMERVGLK